MSRSLTADEVSALTSGRVYPAYFVQLEWGSGTTRYWSGNADATWNSLTWTGGRLVRVNAISETAELRAVGVEIVLGGVDSAELSLALSYTRVGKPVKIWLHLLSAAGVVLGGTDPTWAGRMDTCRGVQGPEPQLVIHAESELAALMRTRTLRYTPESQKALYPGDKGLDYLPRQLSWSGQWGTAAVGNQRWAQILAARELSGLGEAGGAGGGI
jgi:hypothetical protein